MNQKFVIEVRGNGQTEWKIVKYVSSIMEGKILVKTYRLLSMYYLAIFRLRSLKSNRTYNTYGA